MSRVNQPVLALLSARARSVGPSAGLLEGPDGGVIFVFGLATFGLRQRRPGRPAVGRGAAGHHQDRLGR
jgi:hypothetical protein